jgi:hypothetical protein
MMNSIASNNKPAPVVVAKVAKTTSSGQSIETVSKDRTHIGHPNALSKDPSRVVLSGKAAKIDAEQDAPKSVVPSSFSWTL